MPFVRAAELLERLTGVQVSAATLRRLTEAAGATLEHVQTAASQEDQEQDTAPQVRDLVSLQLGEQHPEPLVTWDLAQVRILFQHFVRRGRTGRLLDAGIG